MFYAQFVLAKKGPLAKIWLAAHWEKKLSKAQIYETSVSDAVQEIMKPKVKIALRTTGHLLLGVVRIYSRKAHYLLLDAGEALSRLKTIWKNGQLIFDDEDVGVPKAIDLPEVNDEYDLAIPELDENEFYQNQLLEQGRYEDITLNDDFSDIENRPIDFIQDFGESLLSKEGSMPFFEELAMLSANSSKIQVPRDRSLQDAHNSTRNIREFTPLVEAKEPNGVVEEPMNFENAPGIDENEADIPLGHGTFLDQSAPAALLENEGANAILANDEAVNDENSSRSSFALDPLTIPVAPISKNKNRKKRRLIMDDDTTLNPNTLKAHMDMYKDTTEPRSIAPPTRRLMQLTKIGGVDQLFSRPGCEIFKAKSMLETYQKALAPREYNDKYTETASQELREELQLAEELDNNFSRELSVVSNLEFDEAPPPMDVTPVFDAVAPIPLDPNDEAEALKQHDNHLDDILFKEPDNKKQRTEEIMGNHQALCIEIEDKFNHRTTELLSKIESKIEEIHSEKIMFSEVAPPETLGRKEAALNLFSLLMLAKQDLICVRQLNPYGDIEIFPNASGRRSRRTETC